jgi:hypothetical protein
MNSGDQLKAERQRADHLALNNRWLVERLDRIHDALCPEHSGTWQQRAEKAVEAAEAVAKSRKEEGGGDEDQVDVQGP